MLLTICTFCLRHRLQRPPPCHPPPSPILASTYEIDASPPSYPHLSSCHVAISAVSTSPTPYYRYTCSTQLPIDAQPAAMPFMSSASPCHSIHLIAAAITTSTLPALTPSPQPQIRPSILVPSPFDPPSQPALNAPNVPSRPLPPASIPQHGIIIAPTPYPSRHVASHDISLSGHSLILPTCLHARCFSCCAYSAAASHLLGLFRPLICLLSAIPSEVHSSKGHWWLQDEILACSWLCLLIVCTCHQLWFVCQR